MQKTIYFLIFTLILIELSFSLVLYYSNRDLDSKGAFNASLLSRRNGLVSHYAGFFGLLSQISGLKSLIVNILIKKYIAL
jgi:hypothetical protein